MRLLICGGREFDDWEKFHAEVQTVYTSQDLSDTFTIISGGAKGADFLARVLAKFHSVPYIEFPADWKKHGRAAGHIRNQQMLDEGKPDMVIAFEGGTGTADMVRRAKKAGIEVKEIK